MCEPAERDEREFAAWRDETAAHFDELAAHGAARAALCGQPARLLRRAAALHILARTLRAIRG